VVDAKEGVAAGRRHNDDIYLLYICVRTNDLQLALGPFRIWFRTLPRRVTCGGDGGIGVELAVWWQAPKWLQRQPQHLQNG
jgi:hypothetical protein